MKQCPYRIVVLVPKLTAVHHGVGLETLPVVTMLALVAFLVLLPTMLCTSAARADRDKSTDWMWRIAAQAQLQVKNYLFIKINVLTLHHETKIGYIVYVTWIIVR